MADIKPGLLTILMEPDKTGFVGQLTQIYLWFGVIFVSGSCEGDGKRSC